MKVKKIIALLLGADAFTIAVGQIPLKIRKKQTLSQWTLKLRLLMSPIIRPFHTE